MSDLIYEEELKDFSIEMKMPVTKGLLYFLISRSDALLLLKAYVGEKYSSKLIINISYLRGSIGAFETFLTFTII